MAHLSAAGGYSTGGASFTYQKGPDGLQYAIGGEVGIDISVVSGNPQATLQKAMVVYGAALAPAEPSAQDRKVASTATQIMAQARAEISLKSQEDRKIELKESAENDSLSERRSVDKDSDTDKALGFVGSADAVQQGTLLTQSQYTNSIVGNPDRNQFDLRMQFSGHYRFPTVR